MNNLAAVYQNVTNEKIWDSYRERVYDFFFKIGPNIVLALLMLIIGIIFIKIIARLITKSFRKYNIEPSLGTFVQSLTRFILYALLIVTVGSTLGIKTSSFIAIIGAAGLAIGLALQGSLANFAGGVLILIFKPFRVNDLIHVNDHLGTVIEIDILYTRLATFDNRIITIPNGTMANSDIDNRTMHDKRRIDLKLKLSYDTDLKKARKVVVEAMSKHPKVLQDPMPDMWLDEFGEYSMKITARCWVEPDNWWPVYWQQLEAIKDALDKEGIKIPVPKQEVYLAGQKESGFGNDAKHK